MQAAIIAVGSELLTAFRTDSNSLFITSALNERGITVAFKIIIGDRRDDLARTVRGALERVPLLVLTGGLGPTDDDITREGVADALGLPLEEDEGILQGIRARFRARGMSMPGTNARQPQVIHGAVVLHNPNGTAPGQLVARDGRHVLLLPGPPREMRPMLLEALDKHLATVVPGIGVQRKVLKTAMKSESYIEQQAQPVYSRWAAMTPPIETTVLAAPGQVELHLSMTSASKEEGERILDDAAAELVSVLGDDVFSDDGRSLEQVVGDLLRSRGWKIGTAESCTGGLLTSRLTDVPGSSDYLDAGVVSYANWAKTALVGVDDATIAANGAVSEPVARAMASGVRKRLGADVGVGITGIAGPAGGSDSKPVGTVFVGVSFPGGEVVKKYRFLGGRDLVKGQAAQAALDMVRRALQAGTPAP
jgi:nicotinamide-nucleotide amidase